VVTTRRRSFFGASYGNASSIQVMMAAENGAIHCTTAPQAHQSGVERYGATTQVHIDLVDPP
jgi:hypothetical protein